MRESSPLTLTAASPTGYTCFPFSPPLGLPAGKKWVAVQAGQSTSGQVATKRQSSNNEAVFDDGDDSFEDGAAPLANSTTLMQGPIALYLKLAPTGGVFHGSR
jgi:hypothetical protein